MRFQLRPFYVWKDSWQNTFEMTETTKCPICLAGIPKSERYPHYVCPDCQNRACDENGRLLKFYNESLSGGFLAFYADTEEKYDSHICYIDDVKCRADEHRFGGIVIEVLKD